MSAAEESSDDSSVLLATSSEDDGDQSDDLSEASILSDGPPKKHSKIVKKQTAAAKKKVGHTEKKGSGKKDLPTVATHNKAASSRVISTGLGSASSSSFAAAGVSTSSQIPMTASSSSSSSSSSSCAAASASSSSSDITRGAPITTDAAAKKLIVQYLRQQNRPYSAIQIHDNLHKRIPKGTIERVLTSLSESDGGDLLCKEYGKAKIYFPNQDKMNSNFSAEDLENIEEENKHLKATLDNLLAQEKRMRSELAELQAQPDDEELDAMLAELQKGVTAKRQRIAGLTGATGSSNNKSSNMTMATAIKAHNFYRNGWASRKRMCMDAVDMISDGMEKAPAKVMSEMCLETDQEVGQTLPALLQEESKQPQQQQSQQRR